MSRCAPSSSTVLADLLNGSMATVRFVASALLG